MAFVSRDLMVNVLYQMAGEGEGEMPGCTPSPTTTPDEYDDGCTPSPPRDGDYDCTPSPPDQGCTPSPGPTGPGDKDTAPRQAFASLRQQLRETLAQA